jgi:RNA recognition motif-containing protein
MAKKLYVGNLSYKTTDAGLRSFFETGGRQVTDVFIVSDRSTGQSRGFGFVEMSTQEEANQVIETLNGAMLDGRALRVSEARERTTGGPPSRGQRDDWQPSDRDERRSRR